MTNPVSLLEKAVNSIIRNKHPSRLLEGAEAEEFLTQGGLRHGRFSLATGMSVGFPAEGTAAIAELAAELRRTKPRYTHGVSLPALAAAVAKEILDRFGPEPAPTADKAAWTDIENAVASWFNASAVARTHYVPCSIVADQAQSFDVGPVSFVHANAFGAHPRRPPYDELAEVTLGPLFQAMRERASTWIAIVEVDGCHPDRSSELADLAVDVALGSLQLVVPVDYGRPIARITARTAPPWRGNLYLAQGQVHAGIMNMEAGHGLSAAAFDQMIADAKQLLDSGGTSIAAFLTGQGSLTKLRQAWCDGVYWFHEALAESLATLATTKFETAIEALLRAESSPKSEARMRDAIKALTGLGPKEFMPGSTTLTVEKFAKELVGARSRVLHGTLSTLLGDVTAESATLAGLAREFLLVFALQLDAYAATPNSKDDRDSLLAWIDAEREAAIKAQSSGAGGP
jgi:hypothetical protein